MENSRIGWTDHTFNPWWGCAKVSPGCAKCYAAALDKRTGGWYWGETAPRRRMGDRYWAQPLKWERQAAAERETFGDAARRPRVFCASMADVFEDRTDLMEDRERLWHLIQKTPHLDWLLLTKRPENVEPLLRLVNAGWGLSAWDELVEHRAPNVWLGATVESNATLHRAETLSWLPGAVRFLSMEPLLEATVPGLRRCEHCKLLGRDGPACENCDRPSMPTPGGIDWVIVGGESGPGARRFDLEWARAIVRECWLFDVPVYVKQLGSNPVDSSRTIGIDGPQSHLRDLGIKHRAGEDWDEFPADLRVRQFPGRKVA